MVWGVMSAFGTGSLYFVEGNMNSEQYQRVLENHLCPSLRQWFRRTGYMFMQDGAPCHRSAKITNYLKKNRIPLLSWPGNSPDMNPIENLWRIMKSELEKCTITTKDQLKKKIEEVWRSERIQTLCRTLVRSMPDRLAALKAAKGLHTKY